MNIFHCVYFHVCETQRTRMHVSDTTATPNGHQMAVVTWDRSIVFNVILIIIIIIVGFVRFCSGLTQVHSTNILCNYPDDWAEN